MPRAQATRCDTVTLTICVTLVTLWHSPHAWQVPRAQATRLEPDTRSCNMIIPYHMYHIEATPRHETWLLYTGAKSTGNSVGTSAHNSFRLRTQSDVEAGKGACHYGRDTSVCVTLVTLWHSLHAWHYVYELARSPMWRRAKVRAGVNLLWGVVEWNLKISMMS